MKKYLRKAFLTFLSVFFISFQAFSYNVKDAKPLYPALKTGRNVQEPFVRKTPPATPLPAAPEDKGVFTYENYKTRAPFSETAMASQPPMYSPNAANEDDPPFPGDPGQMPLGDAFLPLLTALAAYVSIKRKSIF